MTDSELIAELADALQTLVEEQNGPPLIKRKGEWNEAMCRAQEVLTKVNSRCNQSPGSEGIPALRPIPPIG